MEYCTWSRIQANEGCDDAVSEPDAYPSLPPWKSELYHRRHNHPPIIFCVWPSCHKKRKQNSRIDVEAVSYPAIHLASLWGLMLRILSEPTRQRNWCPSTADFSVVWALNHSSIKVHQWTLEGKMHEEQTDKKSCLYVSPGGWGTWSFCKRPILRERKNAGQWLHSYLTIQLTSNMKQWDKLSLNLVSR